MLEIALFTAVVAAAALLLQDRLGIPTPISIITGVVAISAAGHRPFAIADAAFDDLASLMLPMLICSDAMAMRWDEIRRNAISLFYVAGIMIALSIGAGIVVSHLLLPDYALRTAEVVALFCMVLATDPVTVSSVFGRFKLPHDLKVIAEGESLLNDATALIAFGMALRWMNHPGPHPSDDPIVYPFQMVAGALVAGAVVGWLGLHAIRRVHDSMTETMLVLAMAFVSYAAAERLHSSAILAVIVSILIANSAITRRLRDSDAVQSTRSNPGVAASIRAVLAPFEGMTKDAADYLEMRANIRFASIVASTILFITMANLVRLDLLSRYWPEIVSVFGATTLIRMAMLGLLARMSRLTPRIVDIPVHWWKVLAAAGVKGAFSLIMLHMIPNDFRYLEMFEAVVVGNILLSTFLYPIALTAIIERHKARFEAEYAENHLRFEE